LAQYQSLISFVIGRDCDEPISFVIASMATVTNPSASSSAGIVAIHHEQQVVYRAMHPFAAKLPKLIFGKADTSDGDIHGMATTLISEIIRDPDLTKHLFLKLAKHKNNALQVANSVGADER